MNVLHFKGDQTNYDPDRVFGPDVGYAHYRPVGATYDPETDLTTIQLQVIMPDEMRARFGELSQKMQQRARIEQIFGAPS